MKLKKLIFNYIFNCKFNYKNEKNIIFLASLVFSILFTVIVFLSKTEQTDSVAESVKENLEILIPKNHVIFPFEADNSETLSGVLQAFGYVRVYSSDTGKLLASHVKILRAPYDPDQLALLIPVNIANYLASFGSNFKIVLQDKSGKKPRIHTNKVSVSTTYGDKEN